MSGQVHVQAVLPSKQAPPILVEFESGWAVEKVWTIRRRTKLLSLVQNQTSAPRPSSL